MNIFCVGDFVQVKSLLNPGAWLPGYVIEVMSEDEYKIKLATGAVWIQSSGVLRHIAGKMDPNKIFKRIL